MTNFSAIFWAALVVNCAVTFRSSDYWKKLSGGEAAIEKEDANQKKAWEGLLKKYLIVYLLATLSDWLQGPYVYGTSRPWSEIIIDPSIQLAHAPWYRIFILDTFVIISSLALYSDYKYSQHDIAVLFVAGFGSSMIFGSFVGGMADWGGRRLFVVLSYTFL